MGTQFSMRDSGTFQSLQMRQRRRAAYLGGGALAITVIVMASTVLLTDKSANAKIEFQGKAQVDEVISQVQVLVPIADIREGTKLEPQLFREVSYLRPEVPEGALQKQELLGNLYAKANVSAGQPILRTAISNTPPNGTVSDLIKPGYRAATIEVDATSGVEGWATAGAHVDIVVTYLDSNDGRKKSQIAIEDAVVLSFNRNTERGKDVNEGKVAGSATVTLSLPVMDALKLHTARSMGRISLILRSNDDAKGVGNAEVTPDDFRTQNSKPTQKVARNSAGFASYVDKNGVSHDFELHNGEVWSPSSVEEIQ